MPVIGDTTGNALTVTVVTQPLILVTVYEIVDVPALTPVTSPVLLIVATAVLLLVQVPPAVASLN